MYLSIEEKLTKTMGLTSTSVGSSTIHRAVESRMKQIQTDDPEHYYQLICTDEDELKNLIEAVIIPETWFFRDHHPFIALATYAKQRTLSPLETIRILSIPCSTGEEPYSIAMTLLQAGMRPNEFSIDAIDISNQNITKAKEAKYGKNSFREEDQRYRDQYFHQENERYALTQEVKDRVRFVQGNILNPQFTPAHTEYDIIFCRNLLIYFDRPTQEKCLLLFEKWLTPGGVFFVGHAETGSSINAIFDIAPYPRAFAFRKRVAQKEKAKEAIVTPKKTSTASILENNRKTIAPASKIKPKIIPPEITNPMPIEVANKARPAEYETVVQIERKANEGRLEEAMLDCNQYLIRYPNVAQVHYLLGLVQQAQGKTRQAKESFQKTIYLEPTHFEALIHLSSMAENQGDQVEAKRYRDRAERIRKKAEVS